MDRDEIIRMAQEAGMQLAWIATVPDTNKMKVLCDFDQVQRFAALIAAAERTRLHDKFMEIHKSQQHSNNYWHFAARKIKEEA